MEKEHLEEPGSDIQHLNVEKHSYNNPEDITDMASQETQIMQETREKIRQNAATLKMVKENGFDYALVKNILDGKVLYKTKNPMAIEYLFGDKD